jgi:hypothetical protein
VVFVSLLAIGGVWTLRRRSEQPMELVGPDEAEPQPGNTGEEAGGNNE